MVLVFLSVRFELSVLNNFFWIDPLLSAFIPFCIQDDASGSNYGSIEAGIYKPDIILSGNCFN